MKEQVDDQTIEFSKLTNHIMQTHPSKRGDNGFTKFRLCEKLGNFNILTCCNRNKQITEMASQIGIGPSLYLMTTKSLACLFFLLTLINLPLMSFYFASSTSLLQDITPNTVLHSVQMGNLPETHPNCFSGALTSATPFLELECKEGSAIG